MWRIPLYWLGLIDLAVVFEANNNDRHFRIIYHDGKGGHFVRDLRSYGNAWRQLGSSGTLLNGEGYMRSWCLYPHHVPKFSWRKQSKVDRVKDRLLGVDNALPS